jgi:hypothetical protein
MKTLHRNRKKNKKLKKRKMLFGRIPKGVPLAIHSNDTGLWAWTGEGSRVIQIAALEGRPQMVGSIYRATELSIMNGNLHIASKEEIKRFSHWLFAYEHFRIKTS